MPPKNGAHVRSRGPLKSPHSRSPHRINWPMAILIKSILFLSSSRVKGLTFLSVYVNDRVPLQALPLLLITKTFGDVNPFLPEVLASRAHLPRLAQSKKYNFGILSHMCKLKGLYYNIRAADRFGFKTIRHNKCNGLLRALSSPVGRPPGDALTFQATPEFRMMAARKCALKLVQYRTHQILIGTSATATLATVARFRARSCGVSECSSANC